MNEIRDTLPLVNVKPNVIVMVFKRLLEPAMIVAYLWVLVRWHGLAFTGDYWVLAIMAFFISSYFFSELHERRLRRNPKGPRLLAPIVIDWLAVVAVLGVVGYVCEFYQQFAPGVIAAWVIGTPVGLLVSQYAASRVMRDLHTKGEVSEAIIIGVNPAALKLAERMEDYPALMIRLLGFFDDREIGRQPQGTFTPLLGKMAGLSGGHFFRATNQRELQNIYDQIDRLEKTRVKQRRFATYQPLYAWPLGAALGWLALELILANTRYRRVP